MNSIDLKNKLDKLDLNNEEDIEKLNKIFIDYKECNEMQILKAGTMLLNGIFDNKQAEKNEIGINYIKECLKKDKEFFNKFKELWKNYRYLGYRNDDNTFIDKYCSTKKNCLNVGVVNVNNIKISGFNDIRNSLRYARKGYSVMDMNEIDLIEMEWMCYSVK